MPCTSEKRYVVPCDLYYSLTKEALSKRGYDDEESEAGARVCLQAAKNGVWCHSSAKLLEMDQRLGSGRGNWVPRAEIRRLHSPYPTIERWNGNRKFGPAVAYRALTEAMKIADRFGQGTIVVDNASYYLYGGGYCYWAAEQGYIASTTCTSARAHVVPYLGKKAALGTNPWTVCYPAPGGKYDFPILIDWATSTISMGGLQLCRAAGEDLPPDAAVDQEGRPTTDPRQARALLAFARHKGYCLSFAIELVAALIGGYRPSARGEWQQPEELKRTACFYFRVEKPDAYDCQQHFGGLSQQENVRTVIDDILAGNEESLIPGQPEAEARRKVEQFGGVLVPASQIGEIAAVAREASVEFDSSSMRIVNL